MTKYYLWLLQLMGAANPRSVQLIKHFGSPRAVYEAVTGGNDRFLKPSEVNSLKRASLEKSNEIIEFCKDNGYNIITLSDKEYPSLLKNIYNPPVLLFTEGDISGLDDEISLTVVGTRKACEYSYMVTEKLCAPLAKIGTVIVSGMAIGVDKIAHTAAVDNGGRTLGVLACGIDVDYPTGSMGFRKRITVCGGAVLTELLPGSRVDKSYFRNRNRILSGLSQGTLVVEASSVSGCHITAKHAVSQNRDLFCIPPHNIFDKRFEGVTGYLRDGAVPVFGFADIINEYKAGYGKKYNSLSQALKETEFYDVKHIEKEAPNSMLPPVVPQKPPAPNLDMLDSRGKIIAELLADGAKTVDFLISESGMDDGDISDTLLDLEIDGIIESAPGACYKLSSD